MQYIVLHHRKKGEKNLKMMQYFLFMMQYYALHHRKKGEKNLPNPAILLQ